MRQVREHFEGDYAGDDEEKRHNDVEKAGADNPDASVPFVFGGEDALYHVLARAAIPDSDGEKAGEDPGERKDLVRGRLEHLKPLGILLYESAEIPGMAQSQNRHQKTG